MTVVFDVCDVDPVDKPLSKEPHLKALERWFYGPVEACSKPHEELLQADYHHFAATIHEAFACHRPLTLSPDHIWLLLCQGVAQHINANAEALRHQIVRHEGKLKIEIRRDDFVKGSPANPWQEVFTEFSQAIKAHTGGLHDLFVANFSTTGALEKAAFEVTLMDATQDYFSLSLSSRCGIPRITLEGTPDDWRAIATRVEQFRPLGLGWWVDRFTPIVNEFVEASEGQVDRDFWGQIYKLEGGSGGPFITGWMIKLFPYIGYQATQRNPYIERDPDPQRRTDGLQISSFPFGLSSVPFDWNYLGQQFSMELMAGFVGITQEDSTGALRPEIGWVVRDLGELAAFDEKLIRKFGGRMEISAIRNLRYLAGRDPRSVVG